MEIKKLLLERRTIHQFKDEKVDPQIIREALTTSLYAPNHKHTQPWRYYWLNLRQREKVTDLALELKRQKSEKKLSAVQEEALKNKFLSPSALIVLGCARGQSEIEERENYASIACGVQNIHLYLWSKGVGSKWSSGAVTRHESVYSWLGVDRDQVELVGFLWIGVPACMPRTPEKAKLEDCLVDFNES